MNFRNFVPYDNNYPTIFEAEKQRLAESVGDIRIEHFGSTAVPGLGGKGYIDIYFAVPKTKMYFYSKKAQKLGYEHRPDGDVPGERLFHKRKWVNKDNSTITFNLHITYLGSENFDLCLAFREYLKAHPEDAKRYAKAKKKASRIANIETEKVKAAQAYADSKSGIIKEILQRMASEKLTEND